MAGTFCPEWIFNLCVARTAYEFIISDLPIKAYAKKYEKGLSDHYQSVTHEEIEASAELILRFLVEINVLAFFGARPFYTRAPKIGS